MTKFILNSGAVLKYPELAKKFFLEVFKGLNPSPNLLICAFATPRENWEQKFAEYKVMLPKLLSGHFTPNLELAFPATFIEQSRKADAIYCMGGDDNLVQYWLSKFDLPKIWDGKVVATNSASSHAMSKHFWTCDWRQTMNGLGVLPIKFLAHFESDFGNDDPRGPIDWHKALEELKKYGDTSLPVYSPREGEFVVFEE